MGLILGRVPIPGCYDDPEVHTGASLMFEHVTIVINLKKQNYYTPAIALFYRYKDSVEVPQKNETDKFCAQSSDDGHVRIVYVSQCYDCNSG